MTATLIVPGLKSSGPDHWQTWLEHRIPGSVRVIQRDWSHADLPEWSNRVRRQIDRIPGRIVIVAHSFGVLAAVAATHEISDAIAGALFVAPADPARLGLEDQVPKHPLPYRSIVVASTNDPWMTLSRAVHWASRWGSDVVNLGPVGHINAEAGFGPWPEGLTLLDRLRHSIQDLDEEAPPYPPLPGEYIARDSGPDPLPIAWRQASARRPRVHGRENIARRLLARNEG
ncbi:MAG: RBBP9/YdeN family alpha/beta hydrolase [Hyphomicrobium sp.]